MMCPRSMRGPASSITTDRPASSICSAIRQPTIPVPAMTTSAPVLLTMRTDLYCLQLERCIVVRGTRSATVLFGKERSVFMECKRPAFSSRAKKRGVAALATASGDDFNNGLDMSYLFRDLDRFNSTLDRDY